MFHLTYEYYIAAKPEDVFAIFVEPGGRGEANFSRQRRRIDV